MSAGAPSASDAIGLSRANLVRAIRLPRSGTASGGHSRTLGQATSAVTDIAATGIATLDGLGFAYRYPPLGDGVKALVVLLLTQLIGGSPTLITSTGRIGELQMDVSMRATIVAAAGRPDAERTGAWNGSRRYRALGFDCSTKRSDRTWPLLAGGPYCRTVFFLDARTGRLGTFFTTSNRYEEAHGVQIGMATATAEQLLRRRVVVGCEANIYSRSLTIAFAGGRRAQNGYLIGGHVEAFALHGRKDDVGVFDCL